MGDSAYTISKSEISESPTVNEIWVTGFSGSEAEDSGSDDDSETVSEEPEEDSEEAPEFEHDTAESKNINPKDISSRNLSFDIMNDLHAQLFYLKFNGI